MVCYDMQACYGSDAAVVVVGSPMLPGSKAAQNIASHEGEGQDREDLQLPARQQELLKTLVKRAPELPLVVVLLHGGALDIEWMVNHKNIAAIMSAGYPGQVRDQCATRNQLGRCKCKQASLTCHWLCHASLLGLPSCCLSNKSSGTSLTRYAIFW
jgi:hypothetical protein